MRNPKLLLVSAVDLSATWCALSLPACESDTPAGSSLSKQDVTQSDTASGGAVEDTAPAAKDTAATSTDPGAASPDPGQISPDPGTTTPDPGESKLDPGEATPDPGETSTDAGTPDLCGNGECDEGEDPCACPADR